MKRMRVLSIVAAMMILILANTVSLPVVASALETEQNPVSEEIQVVEEDSSDSDVLSSKAMAAALVVGMVGAAGAIGMAIAIAKSTDGMARQPEAAGKINSAMMLGLVFIETAIIYALIIAILIIFVL